MIILIYLCGSHIEKKQSISKEIFNAERNMDEYLTLPIIDAGYAEVTVL
jgi:hypothetical protein